MFSSFKQNIDSKQVPFWVLTAAVFILLICPTLLQDGMFMDGQQYANVSKNLADGLGSFWFPHLSNTWWRAGSSHFMEHPPLIYGIQSLFFSLFGNSLYVERLYNLFLAILSAWLIKEIWNTLFSTYSSKKLAWLPILLWILTPVVYWSFQNNMHETSMGLFVLLAVWFSLKALTQKKNVFFWLCASGLSIFLASFSKGVPGLFPLVTVVLYGLVYQKHSLKEIIVYSLVLLSIPILIYASLTFNDTAMESLSFYFNERLLNRVSNEPVVSNRFFILQKLFLELLPSIILTLLLLLIAKMKRLKWHLSQNRKPFVFALTLGLTGALPLLLTPVQRGFYLFPSFPFFAIALSLLLIPAIQFLVQELETNKLAKTVWISISSLLFVFSIVFSLSKLGTIGRDKEMLKDVYELGELIPNNSILAIDSELYTTWNLQFYFQRHFNISLDPKPNEHLYYLSSKAGRAPQGYKKIESSFYLYHLYIKE